MRRLTVPRELRSEVAENRCFVPPSERQFRVVLAVARGVLLVNLGALAALNLFAAVVDHDHWPVLSFAALCCAVHAVVSSRALRSTTVAELKVRPASTRRTP